MDTVAGPSGTLTSLRQEHGSHTTRVLRGFKDTATPRPLDDVVEAAWPLSST